MALPLKSGADLYNQQALRLRLHNLGADPLEVGEGLIYYNTSTGLNTSGKARIYTGAGWKTLAFSEDLDVASNADFLALKEKVDLLAGDVNTDAIISNMKEVAAFLDGFAEDADLMTYLTTELGKKLDKTGGTITGDLQIRNNSGESTLLLGTKGRVYCDASGLETALYNAGDGYPAVKVRAGTAHPIFRYSSVDYTLIHSGNIGSQYVKGFVQVGANASGRYDANELVNGGILVNSESYSKWDNAPTGANVGALIHFAPSGNRLYSLQMFVDGASEKLSVRNCLLTQAWSAWKTIAFTDSTVASAYKLVTSAGADAVTIGSNGLELHSGFIGYKDGDAYRYLGPQGSQKKLRFYDSTEWKDIAFIDSNVASATKLETARTIWGQSFDGTEKVSGDITLENASIFGASNRRALQTSSTDLYIGSGYTASGDRTFLYGNVIRMYTGTGSQSMFINSSGGVTIGASDLAGTGAKLYVDGDVKVSKSLSVFNQISFTRANHCYIWGASGSAFHFGSDAVGGTSPAYASLSIYSDSVTPGTRDNAVSLGTSIYRWSDVYAVNGTFSGNITATGEISCGGAGEEGVGGGGASVFQHVFTPSASPSVTILHNLGTEDIVITLYEKDATSGLWSVCLTDIEIVSANEVTITFGSTSNQEHKVVIMGGAA